MFEFDIAVTIANIWFHRALFKSDELDRSCKFDCMELDSPTLPVWVWLETLESDRVQCLPYSILRLSRPRPNLSIADFHLSKPSRQGGIDSKRIFPFLFNVRIPPFAQSPQSIRLGHVPRWKTIQNAIPPTQRVQDFWIIVLPRIQAPQFGRSWSRSSESRKNRPIIRPHAIRTRTQNQARFRLLPGRAVSSFHLRNIGTVDHIHRTFPPQEECFRVHVHQLPIFLSTSFSPYGQLILRAQFLLGARIRTVDIGWTNGRFSPHAGYR